MSSESSSDEEEELSWYETLQRIKENDSRVEIINPGGDDIKNMTNEELEELGRDIADNAHLVEINLSHAALNDRSTTFLFQGLTRSSSIEELQLYSSLLYSNSNHFGTTGLRGFSAAGVRSMLPFLQNANSLTCLSLDNNNIQSEGFNLLFRALSDSPIESLGVNRCGIETIEIDIEHSPRHLKRLYLSENNITIDGCLELAKLLQGGDAALTVLNLQRNDIDDGGAEILVGALRSNTSLTVLDVRGNSGISKRGVKMMLELVNDISSIEATLRSNHAMEYLWVTCNEDEPIKLIDNATNISYKASSPEAAGREKVIRTQLNSKKRAQLAALQGVNHSVYSEIDPLHLPEVLALVGRRHGQAELYLALKSSIAGVISTVNREQCIEVQMAYHASKLEEHASKLEQLGAELAAIKAARGGRAEAEESHNNKRRRK